MLPFILDGIRLGFAAGTLPGPFQSYIINTTVMQGWRKSFFVIFSPLIVDIPIILLVVFILGQVPLVVIRIIQAAGGLFLLWIAWGAWGRFRAGAALEADTSAAPPNRQIMRRGMLMNALSPGPYIFWSTVTGPLLIQALEQSAFHAVAFLASFYGTFLTMLALLVLIFDRARRLDKRVTQGILLVTIALLVWFGASLLVQAVQG
jgi:threonine/homoserine/homoserine lactone efflux protein